MAVVFISPKQRQNVFFIGITVAFILFLIIVFSGVFLAKPAELSGTLVFNKPKINIDMAVFSTDQFNDLQSFSELKTQYSYEAVNSSRKFVKGFLSASSKEEAKSILEGNGLTVQKIEEAQVGRDNPFVTFYQVVRANVPKK